MSFTVKYLSHPECSTRTREDDFTFFPHLVRQLCNVKETRQHAEEEVGAFTKLIEAMGFTGTLKYNKWVSEGRRDVRDGEGRDVSRSHFIPNKDAFL